MKGPTSSDKRLRLFENRWLEKLTVISVGWFVAIWATVLTYLGVTARGSAPVITALGLVAAGWLLFTGLEYVLHRYLFHWTPKSDWMAKMVFVMHGNHHLEPADKLRALMPPIVSFPIGIAVSSLIALTFGQTGDWLFFGFVLGYIVYDITHYASHHWPMSNRLATRFKRHHLLHHFIADHGNYAVTGLFWDRLLGTKINAADRRVRRSAAGKTAGVSPSFPGADVDEAPEPAE